MSNTFIQRTASVVIYQGDDMERLAELARKASSLEAKHEEAKRQVDRAIRDGSLRVGDDLPAEYAEDLAAARAAYDAEVDEAAERATEVRVVALKRRAFRDLMAEHPPREGNGDDSRYEVNVDTFAGPFLVKSITAPAGFDPEDLPDGEYEKLFATAYYLNRLPSQDPKDHSWRGSRSFDAI